MHLFTLWLLCSFCTVKGGRLGLYFKELIAWVAL